MYFKDLNLVSTFSDDIMNTREVMYIECWAYSQLGNELQWYRENDF